MITHLDLGSRFTPSEKLRLVLPPGKQELKDQLREMRNRQGKAPTCLGVPAAASAGRGGLAPAAAEGSERRPSSQLLREGWFRGRGRGGEQTAGGAGGPGRRAPPGGGRGGRAALRAGLGSCDALAGSGAAETQSANPTSPTETRFPWSDPLSPISHSRYPGSAAEDGGYGGGGKEPAGLRWGEARFPLILPRGVTKIQERVENFIDPDMKDHLKITVLQISSFYSRGNWDTEEKYLSSVT